MPRSDLIIQTSRGRILAEVKAANEDIEYEHDLAVSQCQRDAECTPHNTNPVFTSRSLARWGARVA